MAFRDLLPRLRPSLLTRVAVSLAVVGLVPLLVSSSRLVKLNRDAMFDEVLSSHAVVVRSAADRVRAFVAGRQALARSAALHPALAEPRSTEAQTLLIESLRSWSELQVLALVVTNPAGEVVMRAQVKDEAVARDVDRALGLAAAEPIAVDNHGGRLLLRIDAPLPGDVGLLRLISEGEPLNRAVDIWETRDRADLVLVDRQGEPIAGSISAAAELPEELLQRALNDEIHGAKRFLEAGVIGAHAPVLGTGWTVLSRQPIAVAEATSLRMRRQSALAVGAALLLIVLLSTATYWTAVRPIRALVRTQRRMAKLEGSLKTRDEIEQLRAGFEALERGTRDREALDEVFLGRYQVLGKISSGGMGTVFRGWDPKLARPVALKTLRLDRPSVPLTGPPTGQPTPATEPDLRTAVHGATLKEGAGLIKEALAVARFNHPNIVAVYDVEDAPEAAFVAMEYIDGISLEQLLRYGNRLSTNRVVPLGAAIADALAAAHRHGVVHRDIKPGNVLLGKDGSIKVTDFGTVRFVSERSVEERKIFGTPGYIPPEALLGDIFSEAGDLFSLGVVLYACLAGRPPFAGRGAREIIPRTLAGRVTPLAEHGVEVLPELEELIMKLLDREPELRGSAKKVHDRLMDLARRREYEWQLSEEELQRVPEAAAPRAEGEWIATEQIEAATRKIGLTRSA
jgi:serine/threonine-protein kinase